MKLYKYELEIDADGKIQATIMEFELVAETDKQYVYKSVNKYYILDLKTYSNKDNKKGFYYYEGNKYLRIKPHITAWLYTKTLSKANENMAKSILSKALEEKFGFIKNIDLSNVIFKEV